MFTESLRHLRPRDTSISFWQYNHSFCPPNFNTSARLLCRCYGSGVQAKEVRQKWFRESLKTAWHEVHPSSHWPTPRPNLPPRNMMQEHRLHTILESRKYTLPSSTLGLGLGVSPSNKHRSSATSLLDVRQSSMGLVVAFANKNGFLEDYEWWMIFTIVLPVLSFSFDWRVT